ncbi:uncharacterized protein LOC128678276 [Plodia interpunctella]|uniref:uncharacterized protein LOC128678276 n=1 Tax=Plodia interpunctella TaxID=58824 RepID=UPI0023688B16|nr:uncharacterized protein LOC128678276 [Plodia interpunctella]XP_053615683.1 uncharacterized protein LOC128678276 [Plodia interpunctella]
MSHHWLLITFWFSPVSLQYINTGPIEPVLENPQSSVHFSIPYVNYLNPPQNPDVDVQSEDFSKFYNRPESDVQRRKRTADYEESHWYQQVEEANKSPFGSSIEEKNQKPFLATYSLITDDNENDTFVDPLEKKNFSPWGGKRNPRHTESNWTWKRSSGLREPSMPKRVRFSPWGGKRSKQMIFKPNSKSSRIIYASVLPELTGIVSNFMPLGRSLNWAGLQLIPTHNLDKRFPIKMLAMSSPLEGKLFRDALPFKAFMDQIPKSYKPGHPYYDVNLKKDGKRKVKFSAWGGKRSPPIIGPIWTPTPTDVKESTLNSILLIRTRNTKDTPKAL